MNGKLARIELQKLLDNGEKLLPSDNCKHFDPVEGCLCRNFDGNGNKIN